MTKIPSEDIIKYQVSEDIKPDKAHLWKVAEEDDGWVKSHNALRGEFQVIREACEAIKERGPLKEWEVKDLQKVIKYHVETIHGHHSNEDDVLVPEVGKFFKYPENLVTDHKGLEEKLKIIERMSQDFQTGDMIDKFLQLWIDYQTYMIPHLKNEEDVALPLVRAYLKPEDLTPIMQKILAREPKIAMGSFIHFDGGPTPFRQGFMKNEGVPSFVWHVYFQWKYKLFMKEFLSRVDALTTGEKPLQKGGCVIL